MPPTHGGDAYGIQHRICPSGCHCTGCRFTGKEGTYGYRITQQVREAIDISESTLYPVLRRLQKDDCLEVYDRAIDGRNRRYYRLTEQGRLQLQLYQREWAVYSQKISHIIKEGDS